MIQQFADWLTYSVFHLDKGQHLSNAVNYFIYDSIKVTLLLAIIVFLVGIIRTFITRKKVRQILSKKKEGIGNIFAAALGVVTPFCSCSAVPLFIGMIDAGVPLGVTFSFLIAAPLINEIAFALLLGMFGWKIAVLYVVTGLVIAIGAGIIIGRLKLEKELEKLPQSTKSKKKEADKTWKDRLSFGFRQSKEITLRVLPFILIGIALAAFIHGYAPKDFLTDIAGKASWYAVPLVVLIGIPLYSNAAGILPIVSVLISKGMAIGTALAFMMSVIGLSIPEMIILRKVLKPKLLAIFIGTLALAFILTGYFFNAILS